MNASHKAGTKHYCPNLFHVSNKLPHASNAIVDMQPFPMVVRIRYRLGARVPFEKGLHAQLARLSSSFLTLVAICLAFMGFWRLFEDFDLSGDFVFASGILSHWQVWLAAAAGTQYVGWRLNVFARANAPTQEELEYQAQDELEYQASEEVETVSSGTPAGLLP